MTTYYIDPEDGNDSAAGTSEGAAWKTWQKVFDVGGLWIGGNTFKGKGGATYKGPLLIGGSTGATDTNRVTVTSYGTGRHIIDCDNKFSEGVVTATWRAVSFADVSNIEVKNVAGINEYTWLTSDKVAFKASGDDGINYHRLESDGSNPDFTTLGLKSGQYIRVAGFTNEANNGSWQIYTVTANRIRVVMGTPTAEAAGNTITIKSNYGYGCQFYSFSGSGANTISDCYIHDVQGTGINLQTYGALLLKDNIISGCLNNGIGIMGVQGTGTLIIEGNIIRDVCKSGNSGDGIFLTGYPSSVDIENDVIVRYNHITYNVAWKSAIVGGPKTDKTLTIYGNTLVGGGIGTVGMNLNQGASLRVYANHISGFKGTSSEVAAAVGINIYGVAATYAGFPTATVYGNVIEDCTVGLGMSGDKAVVESQTGSFYNNDISGCDYGVRKDSFASITLKNNRFWDNTIDLYVGADTTAYVGDYNCFSSVGTEYIANYKDGGAAYSTLAAYQAAASNDQNSVDSLTECAGAGVWISGVRAYDDLPLPLSPDIGAVQDRTAPGRRFGVGGGTL